MPTSSRPRRSTSSNASDRSTRTPDDGVVRGLFPSSRLTPPFVETGTNAPSAARFRSPQATGPDAAATSITMAGTNAPRAPWRWAPRQASDTSAGAPTTAYPGDVSATRDHSPPPKPARIAASLRGRPAATTTTSISDATSSSARVSGYNVPAVYSSSGEVAVRVAAATAATGPAMRPANSPTTGTAAARHTTPMSRSPTTPNPSRSPSDSTNGHTGGR